MQWFYVALVVTGLIVILAIIRKTLKTFFSSFLEGQDQLFQRIEKKQEAVSESLNRFASAMAEYAKHLESHTEAIQNLANASGELKEAAKEQTKFLKGLAEILEKPKKEGE